MCFDLNEICEINPSGVCCEFFCSNNSLRENGLEKLQRTQWTAHFLYLYGMQL